MTQFYLSPEQAYDFERLVQEAISAELEKKRNLPNLYTTEAVYQEYLDYANDYEKYYLLNQYYNGQYRQLSDVGISYLRNNFNTELINENYDAYEYAQSQNIGDFDLAEVYRDDYGNLVSIVCNVHQDRWAAMSDMYKTDNITTIQLDVM